MMTMMASTIQASHGRMCMYVNDRSKEKKEMLKNEGFQCLVMCDKLMMYVAYL